MSGAEQIVVKGAGNMPTKVNGNVQRDAEIDAARVAFLEENPNFDDVEQAALREREYARLDRLDQVYLDYTGGGLHAESQLRQHMDLLANSVLGNPHSHNPTSLAATELVERARAYVLSYFNADPAEYVVIFTANASGALKLVGESYPFAPGARYLLTFDNHNSVNGIREFARSRGAEFTYTPLTSPDLRLDRAALDSELARIDPAHPHLFAFPAQSNFSGVQHPLSLIEDAQALGWDVLLDAAAFAPTNRLDLGRWHPEFVVMSFYKMFGYPTGLGCLLARRDALAKLHRPWFAGGTITIASVQGDGFYYAEDEAAFEDGTVDFLNIPAIEIGLKHIEGVGIETIHNRVTALTGWLLDELGALKHSNGRALFQIHGPRTTEARGGTITVTFYDRDGVALDERRVEELANHVNISLRTGCFCNPGAGEIAHDLTPKVMTSLFDSDHAVSFDELRDVLVNNYHKSIGSIRISVGIATNFADVYRCVEYVKGFLDKTVAEIGPVSHDAGHGQPVRTGV